MIEELNKGNIKLVNLKKSPVYYDDYIGRQNKWLNLKESKWHNPFILKRESERAEILVKYEQYLRSRPDLIACLHELKGKTLACYCYPKKCHGDVLIKLYNEFVK